MRKVETIEVKAEYKFARIQSRSQIKKNLKQQILTSDSDVHVYLFTNLQFKGEKNLKERAFRKHKISPNLQISRVQITIVTNFDHNFRTNSF